MSTEGYALLFTEGAHTGEAYLLEDNEISLGRSRSNQIVINDELISRQHIKFRMQGSDIMVEDLDSAHGSFLNEKRLRGILSVAEGDVIQVGSQKLKIVNASEVDGVVDRTMKELDEIDKAAAAAEIAEQDEQDKTRFASGAEDEDQDETKYFQAKEYHSEDEDAKTRAFDDSATRMLDVEELQGLKSSKDPGGSKGKMIAGMVLLVLLLVGAGGGIVYMLGQEDADPSARKLYSDKEYLFNVRYPAIWQKSTLSDQNALIVLEWVEEGVPVAYLKVFGERSLDFEIEGLVTGFAAYKEQVAERHNDFVLKGSKVLTLNNVLLVQYGFSTDVLRGLGIFTYHGLTRLDVEVAVRRERYQDFKRTMIELLQSFSLIEKQVVFNFPVADDEIRKLALSNPSGLTKQALENALRARDLYERRGVRTDNLFRSVTEYRTAMQKLGALGTRPPEYEEVAKELATASQTLNKEIEDQKYTILMAQKSGDKERAKWELTKLLRLVPDKNHPVHIKAKSDLKWYP